MKRSSTLKMQQRISLLTKNAYENAVREVNCLPEGDAFQEELYIAMDMMRHPDDFDSDEEVYQNVLAAKNEVDRIYLETLLKTSTRTLEDIIIVHESGHIKRTPKVLEAIKSELARRALFGDVYQSDTK